MNENTIEYDDDDYDDEYVEQIRAESELIGEVKGLRRAIVTIIDRNYPSLIDLAQQAAQLLDTPGTLNLFLYQLSGAYDEASSRMLLNLIIKIRTHPEDNV